MGLALGVVFLGLLTFFTATFWHMLTANSAWAATHWTGSEGAAEALNVMGADVAQATSVTVGPGSLTCQWTTTAGTAVQVAYQETQGVLLRTVTTTPAGGSPTRTTRPVTTGLASTGFQVSQPTSATVTVTLTWQTGASTVSSASTFTVRAWAPAP